MLELLETSPTYLVGTSLVFGLIIGSFLNVVIYRLPIVMQRDFKGQALSFLKETGELPENTNLDSLEEEQEKKEGFNLLVPNSHCPNCKHQIKAVENIPVISYLILGGKCSQCKNPISIRYPLVELSTGIISAIVAWHFGFSWQLAAALVFSYAMIAQAMIDWDTQYLLDDITFPLLWLGLLVNTQGLFTTLENAVWGAALGYLSLWSVFWTYKLISGKEGMGYGDFKLMALLGAWMGWQFIPLIILLSSVTGSVIGITAMTFSKGDMDKPIPFGPYIASAGWIALLWGNQIIDTYLGLMKV